MSGLPEQGLREQDLHLQARVGIAHEVVVQLDRDAEALQELGGVGFGLPAVQLGKFGLEFAGAEAVFLGEVLFFIEGVLLLHDIVEVLVAHDDGVEDGVFVVLELILLEDGHVRAPGLRKISPDVGSSSPESIFWKVDLPAPFEPMTP